VMPRSSPLPSLTVRCHVPHFLPGNIMSLTGIYSLALCVKSFFKREVPLLKYLF
jgi:hypothetical protein